jgi:hypothetical protein
MALKRSSTIGVRTTLDADLAREAARIARAQGRSRSSVIAEAVGKALAPGLDAGPEARVAAGEPHPQAMRLARIEARLERGLREQAILMESVLLCVRVWLEHTPPLEEGPDEAAAAAVAAGRFERFLDLIAVSLAAGGAARAFGRDGAAWGEGLGFQPLADMDDPLERAWAQDWLLGVIVAADAAVSPELRLELWRALDLLGERAPGGPHAVAVCRLGAGRASARSARAVHPCRAARAAS